MERKEFIPQTRFAAILQVHENTFFLKNYSEQMVNARDKQGAFMSRLSAAFKDAYVNNIEQYRIHEFTVDLTGYFGPSKDPVEFRFLFAYDPYNIRLNLRSMTAILGKDYRLTYRIKSHPSRDLAPSAKVYQDLLIEKAKQTEAEKHPSGRKRHKNAGSLKHSVRS